jgi:hypothetical protein
MLQLVEDTCMADMSGITWKRLVWQAYSGWPGLDLMCL